MSPVLRSQVYRAIKAAAIAYAPLLVMGLIRKIVARRGAEPLSSEFRPEMLLRARRQPKPAVNEARG